MESSPLYQQINVEGMMELENHYFDNHWHWVTRMWINQWMLKELDESLMRIFT